MIPWLAQVHDGTTHVFNIGPEELCGIHGSELWVSNLTDAGTHRLVSVASVSAEQPAALPQKVLYVAASDATGAELWVTDGTPEQTMLVKDIWPGPQSSATGMLIPCGELVFFSADDGEHGSELWASDGTALGTTLVSDLSAGASGTKLSLGECHTGRLYFHVVQPDGSGGDARERWTSSGTAESTVPAPLKAEL